MKLRSMKNKFEGFVFYESTFAPDTGTLVRTTEEPDTKESWYSSIIDVIAKDAPFDKISDIRDRWRNKYGSRNKAFSPSPETIDISITDWCNFGCSYCYQDSTERQKHAPKDLVSTVIKNFDVPPYQIAIGGGEPTAHPDFPEIIWSARELGVVPNYTTAGHIVRPEVIEATNKVCGGVSMTFHAWKGKNWFKEHYKTLRSRLTTRLNVHLIADKDVADNLKYLTSIQDKVGKLSVILLAYYPSVGRGTIHGIMPKHVYNDELPKAIRKATKDRMTLAFSEGLLPYFLSRPTLLETKFATKSEGLFSAYVDPRGFMSHSSFEPPPKPGEVSSKGGSILEQLRHNKDRLNSLDNAWKGTLQAQWDMSSHWPTQPHGAPCYECKVRDRCATPDVNHMLVCKYMRHNQ